MKSRYFQESLGRRIGPLKEERLSGGRLKNHATLKNERLQFWNIQLWDQILKENWKQYYNYKKVKNWKEKEICSEQ